VKDRAQFALFAGVSVMIAEGCAVVDRASKAAWVHHSALCKSDPLFSGAGAV